MVLKSKALNDMKQNYSSFNEYLKDTSKEVHSFSSPNKDGILVIPGLKIANDNDKTQIDYKNISQFTENAPAEKQQMLWKEVVEKLSEQLEENNEPRWLSTHGLGHGTNYLHVRIYDNPKYYHVEEYKKS